MKILIAEDDRVTRSLVARVVARGGTIVLEAENGLDALSIVEQDDPDALITDLRMPVLDGFELITAVRASPKHRQLPIICLSGVNERQDITRLAALGITDYVLKPPKAAELVARLDKVIREHSRWKLRRTLAASARSAPPALIIDPDANLRAAIRARLEPAFLVIEAASGADGLHEVRSQAPAPEVVLVGDGLQLLPSDAIPALVRRIVSEAGGTPPTILLLTTSGDVAPEVAAQFDGTIARGLVGEGFLEEVNRARGASTRAPADLTDASASAPQLPFANSTS